MAVAFDGLTFLHECHEICTFDVFGAMGHVHILITRCDLDSRANFHIILQLKFIMALNILHAQFLLIPLDIISVIRDVVNGAHLRRLPYFVHRNTGSTPLRNLIVHVDIRDCQIGRALREFNIDNPKPIIICSITTIMFKILLFMVAVM